MVVDVVKELGEELCLLVVMAWAMGGRRWKNEMEIGKSALCVIRSK